MSETWFEHLFKFKRINYEEGDFLFQAGNAAYLFLGLLLILLISFLIIYFLTNIYARDRSRVFSISLRIIVLLLLCFPLLTVISDRPDMMILILYYWIIRTAYCPNWKKTLEFVITFLVTKHRVWTV